jgi:hypothetical protein
MLIPSGEYTASAQMLEYFSAPQAAPQNPGNQTAGQAPSSQQTNPYGAGTSSLYGQIQSQSAAAAPPWILTEHVGIDEIATDDIDFPLAGRRQADLGSLFSAGGTLTADSVRVYGILSLTGIYRRQVEDSAINGFLGTGYANEMVTLLPGSLYLGLRGLVDDVSREGLGLQNPFAGTQGYFSQAYQISATPLYYTRIDALTFNLLRYEIGQIWYDRNNGIVTSQGTIIPAISNSSDQVARDDFRMDGTVFQRLLTDVSLSAASFNNSGSRNSSDFTREQGQVVNAFALTRSLALVAAAGYERLHDRASPRVNGQDATWSAGIRFLPNADSYALLTYGRQDLRSDFAGELGWSVTPRTNLYMDYTDSVITLQQAQVSDNNVSEIGPYGAITHVSFDESPVISTLDDPLLIRPPGPDSPTTTLGVPLADISNALPLTNGLYRIKALRASASSEVEDNVFRLTLLNIDETQLTALGPLQLGQLGSATLQQAILSWGRFLSPDVSARIAVNVGHLSEDQILGRALSESTNRYGTTLIANWQMSNRLYWQFRYDFIGSGKSLNLYANVLSVGLHVTID